ncbi:MAG: sulfite exporter TauE/SafE family protein [Candidatus Altiarchaeota archaeon]
MKEKRKHLTTKKIKVNGMVCGSCEKVITKHALGLNGVKDVKADHKTGDCEITFDERKVSIAEIYERINEKGYHCSESTKAGMKGISVALGLLALAIGAYIILQPRFEAYMPALDQNTSLALIFIIGLFTGFHCVAMCGGFVVSYAVNEGKAYMSHIRYGLAKTLSYAFFGGVFGFIGSFITFTPFMRGAAAVIAGTFLVLFGLNMLDMFTWFRRFRFGMPSFVEGKMGKSKNPTMIGLLNGLMIACGPLQAMYVFAAASGSPYYGALSLAVFGLGTLPVLLGFGVLTSLMSSKLTHNIVRYSGVLVVVLGLIMVNRGVALTGTGYDVKTLTESVQPAVGTAGGIELDSDGYQVIRMNVTASGWNPDKFTLKRGVPVRWVIDGQEITSCNNAIQVPKYGLRFDIKKGLQTIEFTPTEAGTVPWSCWMGMIQGTFEVKDDISVNNAGQTQAETPATGDTPTTIPTTKESPTGYQIIRMNVTYSGWEPDRFVLKKGVPVKWIIDGQQLTGCNSGIKVPSLGLQFNIKKGLQTIEFTPDKEGTVPWSCWMGMIKGTFIVKGDIDTSDSQQVQAALNEAPAPQKSSGGCGCSRM